MRGVVEIDEVYVVAGHKGNPIATQKKAARDAAGASQGAPGRGTLEKEKPPILGVSKEAVRSFSTCCPTSGRRRSSRLSRRLSPKVRCFIRMNMTSTTAFRSWGYQHQSGCHSKGEYARDADGDGFHEIHVNTMEGFWSLLRSWLRPHRGISQEKLPIYLGFFQLVHNARKRGKQLLATLVSALVA